MAVKLSQIAYDHILAAIVEGRLPVGDTVSENALAEELSISRSPVREAIGRLQAEGLVRQIPRYGTVVRFPEREELRELFELREALECFAVEKACAKATPEDIEALAALVDRIREIAYELRAGEHSVLGDDLLQDFLDTDQTFHMRIIRIAGNRRIMKSVRESRVLAGIFGRPRQEHDLAVVARTYRRHAQVLRAIEKGDSASARARTSAHIQSSCRKALMHHDRKRLEMSLL